MFDRNVIIVVGLLARIMALLCIPTQIIFLILCFSELHPLMREGFIPTQDMYRVIGYFIIGSIAYQIKQSMDRTADSLDKQLDRMNS